MYSKYIKRLLDFSISLAAIVVLSPLFLILSALVKINLGSPIIFKQERAGRNEKIFTMYKFRTMTDRRDKTGELLPDAERQTKFGCALRSSGLDELPELYNILRGDLSIVGPRPLLASYLPYYTSEERKRHAVRGGLTQPEVLYGLVNPTWDEQLGLEAEYADHVTFLTDVKIIFATIKIILKRVETDYGKGIRQPLDIERADRRNKQ